MAFSFAISSNRMHCRAYHRPAIRWTTADPVLHIRAIYKFSPQISRRGECPIDLDMHFLTQPRPFPQIRSAGLYVQMCNFYICPDLTHISRDTPRNPTSVFLQIRCF